MSIDQRFYPEIAAGGFSRHDGTLQFYSRVNALLRREMTVVDIGAGRGRADEDHTSPYRRDLVRLRGKVSEVVGVDIDPAVRTNPNLDRAVLYDGSHIPLETGAVDLVVSDATLEHVRDAEAFSREVARILRPGGWFCARTPYLYSAMVGASLLVPNRLHKAVLKIAQPSRKPEDVFDTAYRMNTKTALKRLFPAGLWENYSYTYSPNPAYHFNNPVAYALTQAYQHLKRPFFGGEVLLVFLQRKHDTPDAARAERRARPSKARAAPELLAARDRL